MMSSLGGSPSQIFSMMKSSVSAPPIGIGMYTTPVESHGNSAMVLPQGVMIEVQGPKKEFLLPFRKEFVTDVDRAERRLSVVVPDGLVE